MPPEKERNVKILLFFLAILAFLIGSVILAYAKNPIHEIQAFMLFLISAVFLSGAAIVEAVNRLRAEISTGKKVEPSI